jgi:hypothetical protein
MSLETAGWSAWAERTEAEITQGTRVVIAESAPPSKTVFQVPPDFAPGAINVRFRIWHGGVASDWSKAATYRVAFNPVPPMATNLVIGAASQGVTLGGATPPDHVDVVRGDHIILYGQFPTHVSADVPISLLQGDKSIRMISVREGFDAVQFSVPEDLPRGRWKLLLEGVETTPALILPTALNVR